MLPCSQGDEDDHPRLKRRRSPKRQRHQPSAQERAQRSLLKRSGRQSRRDRKKDAAEALECYLTSHPCDAHDARYATEAILDAQIEVVEGAYWCWIMEEWMKSFEKTLRKRKRKGKGKGRRKGKAVKGEEHAGKVENGKKNMNADVKNGGTTSRNTRKASSLENSNGSNETQRKTGNGTGAKEETGRTKKTRVTKLRHGRFLVTFVERTPEEWAVERAQLKEKSRLRYERPAPTVWDVVNECLRSAGAGA